LLPLIALAGWLLVASASAQSTDAAVTKTGILGTVVDIGDDPIPNATVVLVAPTGDHLTAVTKDDGSFAFHDVTTGVDYQIKVSAEGFAEWSSRVTVEPGQNKTLADIKLRILAVQRALTVVTPRKRLQPNSSRSKNISAFWVSYRIFL
jgi:hypothetical protein